MRFCHSFPEGYESRFITTNDGTITLGYEQAVPGLFFLQYTIDYLLDRGLCLQSSAGINF
ncbi:MAG TPA: hypothetical protein HA269_03480 [Ferroplasma sp.]|nr:hypothetical protein [Ferroplasma sp.]